MSTIIQTLKQRAWLLFLITMIATHVGVYTSVPPMDGPHVVVARSFSSDLTVKSLCVMTACMLGFFLGLLIMATDVAGVVFFLPQGRKGSAMLFKMIWAMVVCLVFCVGSVLFCRWVKTMLNPRQVERMKALERHAFLGAVLGSTIGIALMDAYLRPPNQ